MADLPQTPPLIIADSSPLIALALVNLLSELTSLASAVWLPETVQRECTVNLALPGASRIKAAIDEGLLNISPDHNLDDPQLQTIAHCIDPGEAQAIATALKTRPSLLLMDDKAGRRCAHALSLPVVGSLGVFIKLKQQKVIPALAPLLTTLHQYGYHYHPDLVQRALKKAGEKPDD